MVLTSHLIRNVWATLAVALHQSPCYFARPRGLPGPSRSSTCKSHHVCTSSRNIMIIEVHGALCNNGTAGGPDGKRHLVTSAYICLGNWHRDAVDIQRDSRLRANGNDSLRDDAVLHIKRHSYRLAVSIRILQRQKLAKAAGSIPFSKTVGGFCRTWFSHVICAAWNHTIITEVLLALGNNGCTGRHLS